MRKNRQANKIGISIMVLDDETIITTSFQDYFERRGYDVTAETDPGRALEKMRKKSYDILLLDYLMRPVCGDEVIREVRTFDRDVFIILVTGHKDMVPPVETIRTFDIQQYHEKGGSLDQLEIKVEACAKAVFQRRLIHAYQKGMETILEEIPQLYGEASREAAAEKMVKSAVKVLDGKRGYVRYRACESDEVFRMYGMSDPEEIGENWLTSEFSDPVESVEGVVAVDAEDFGRGNGKRLLDIYSRQAASAVGNSILYERLIKSMDEKEQAYMETIQAVLAAVEQKDRYTTGHSRRVSSLAAWIAEEMGFEQDFVERTALAGIFHDIGKIGIPDGILSKNERLTETEYEIMKKHPVKSAGILSGIRRFEEILPIVKCHHEKMDGTGYPEGISGESIPMEARIIAVADTFDAMTSDRSYRESVSFEKAMDELGGGRGSQLDSSVVDAFFHLSERFGKEGILKKAGSDMFFEKNENI